jgi:uridine kinase
MIGGRELSTGEISQIKEYMTEYVRRNISIEKEKVSLEQAIRYFQEKAFDDKLRLLKSRKKQYLILYRLENHKDYHHGYMVPSTGYLKIFDILPRGDGFILQYPRRKTPKMLYPMPKYHKLLDIFTQYGTWLESLDIDSVAALNNSIEAGSVREVILVSEALHEQKIAQIAEKIATKSNSVRIILIAGPTSSGKTTFSKRLAIQLLTHGISPFALEMDNYFVNRLNTPLDEFGKPNFEAFEAINSQLLNEHLSSLLAGEEVQLPRFNFKTGVRGKGDIVRIDKNQVIVIEGIHGLNPKLLNNIAGKNTFRIYTSCLTQLNLDHYNRISTTDTRMLRRIIRDARHRGYTAQRTIEMWESVRRGEREYIFPYQENADEIFNSALVYELAVIKSYADPLLRQIPFGTDEHLEAKRLLAFLDWFLPIDGELVPDNSILREFIGDSILRDFHLWKNRPTV